MVQRKMLPHDGTVSSQEIAVHFDEITEGDFRIYAGALEAPRGDGYIAAVIVNRLRGPGQSPKEVYRDTALSGGHRWASPAAALAYAVNQAQTMIRTQPERLAC